jgi:hypothetical protein
MLAAGHAQSRSPAVRNSLATAGYTQEEHQHACDLLMVIAGSGVEIAPTPTTTEASRAMAELNEADEPFFKRAEAVLRRHHPAHADFLFDNLAPVHGPDAFLGRRHGSHPHSDRKRRAARTGRRLRRRLRRIPDQAALSLTNVGERARLPALTRTLRKLKVPPDNPPISSVSPLARREARGE